MKLTLSLLLIAVVSFATEGFSQSAKLKLKMENATLVEIFQEIERTSDIGFLFKNEQLDLSKKYSLDAENKSVEDIMKMLLEDKYNYQFLGNNIVITAKSEMVIAGQEQKAVSGTVTDSTGAPLPSVTVVVKGTTNGTITDFDGKYTLANVPADATIVFSFVGMKTQEISAEGKSVINITMAEDAIGIEEVVAIGYGTMKKSDLTGSVASVQGDKIAERVASTQLSQALQGITPGLMVTRSGAGDASVSATIRVRGITTIGDSNPLVIVDGTPSTLDWVNPNDIESISVLKDAASAAIYGSRAAAGVILVTTKRAKEGQLNMSYDFNYSMEQPTRIAAMQGAVDYMKSQNELVWNDAGNKVGEEYPLFAKDLIDSYPELNSNDQYNYPDTNWHDLMLKKSAIQKHHMFSISAGTKHVNTYISLSVDNTEGLFMGKGYDRMTIRANNDININKYFSAEINLTGLYSKNTNPQSSLTQEAVIPGIIADPLGVPEWADGRIGPGKDGENPYAILKHAGSKVAKEYIGGVKSQLNYTPIPDLKFSVAYFAEVTNNKYKNFRRQLTYTGIDDPSTVMGLIRNAETTKLEEGRTDNLSTTFQAFSNYTKSFNKHDLNLTLGFEENYEFHETLGAIRDQYVLKNFPYLDLGNENYQYNSGNAREYANRSFFGRLVYDFDNKYLLQSNVRYDGSSRFNKNYRWGLFPSVSMGWVISEESFMEDVNEVDFLKVRASWGALGNERIGYYPYQSTIGFTSVLLLQGNDVVAAQGAGVMDYAISDISWETTETYDFGVDVNFLDNRLNITADYYKKTTRDMLLALEIPDFIGLNNPNQNTGKMHTTGWELSFGWNNKIGNLKYSVNAHVSDFKSVMGDLGGTEFLGDKVKFKGSEFNEWYGYLSDGLYQTREEVDNSPSLYSTVKPGDIKYLDISGPDGVPDGIISAAYDRTLLGGSLPRYSYGGSINLGYKNFDFNLVFQGIGKQYMRTSNEMIYPYQGYQEILLGNSWSFYNTEEQNLKVKYPRLTSTGRSNNYTTSDFWMFNGAYFRLKNVTLAYNLPKMLTKKLKFNNLKIYASMSDLFSIDNYPEGWDPETTDTYWATRSLTFGVSVKF